METFPHVHVEGGPLERGRQYGEQTRDRIGMSVAAYREVFRHYAGWDWPRVTREALRYEGPIRKYGANYLEEIRGIAEGAGMPYEDILAINTRTEVMFAAKARAASGSSVPLECSAFAVLAEASADGHTLVGQNWDWLLHCFDTVVVLEARQDNGPDFVTVVEAGLLAKTGMNSSGLGLVTNALVTEADRGEPAIPFHVLLRAILDCENVSDVLTALQRSPRSSSANYLVAHDDGIALDVEAAPGDFSRLFLLFPEGGILLHTNHFVSSSFDGKDVSVWAMPDSPVRLARLQAATATGGPKLSIGHFKTILGDHANFPSGICCHPDSRFDELDRSATVASVLMDLDARRMWVADGHPCTTPFRELDYGEFLAKPSAVRLPA